MCVWNLVTMGEAQYREILGWLGCLFWPFVELWGCLKACMCGLVDWVRDVWDDCLEPCLEKSGGAFVCLGLWIAQCAGFVGDYLT